MEARIRWFSKKPFEQQHIEPYPLNGYGLFAFSLLTGRGLPSRSLESGLGGRRWQLTPEQTATAYGEDGANATTIRLGQLLDDHESDAVALLACGWTGREARAFREQSLPFAQRYARSRIHSFDTEGTISDLEPHHDAASQWGELDRVR